jgi:hypothetical protein
MKDRAEKEAIDVFVDSIKTYGYQAAIFIMNLLQGEVKPSS